MDKNHEKYQDFYISLSSQTQDVDLVIAIFEVLNSRQVESVYDAVIKKKSINLIQIRLNPYILVGEFDGIGFLTADKLGVRLGIKNDDPNRVKFGILYAIKQIELSGDCACEKRKLIASARQLLNVNDCDINGICNDLCKSGILVISSRNNLIFYQMAIMNNAELIVAERLTSFRDYYCNPVDIPDDCKDLSDSQMSAIELIANSNVAIITGGPGTGKTYLINKILELFSVPVCLLAPTGKAAKRIKESTGHEALTIHRALGFRGYGFEQFISSKVVIIDEFSMVDIRLFAELLSRMTCRNPRIYLVGDVNQLPSVGPGNTLDDLIASGHFPVAKLTEIHRQSQKSQIIMGAHDINQGIRPQLLGTDLMICTFSSAYYIADAIVETARNLLLDKKIDIKDVQVLSPMKKGVCGTIELNNRLQALLNPNSKSKNKVGFYKGDRVINLKNDYDLNVMNGSVGTVEFVEWSKSKKRYEVSVVFDDDGSVITFCGHDIYHITLAYAITIHKSQGSEYPYVIMPVTSAHYIMLNRNLTYTGLTRAKKVAFMFIDDNGMTRAISTRRANRVTFLVNKIKALSNE
jgi:exodeoxyribonuclease V alpha subunit